jgi:hypothetical protein
MRKWMLAVFVSCAVLAAQTKPTDVFEKAPPQVDNALRERVSKFFQAHVDGKFRLAEEVVAEDSKDFFYNMEKQRYLGFEIVRINYSENFTKATVVTAVEVEWRSPRIGVMRVKPPMTSLWRQDNGVWYWYVVPQKDWETPWGKMKPGPDTPEQKRMMAMFKGVDVAEVTRQVAIDKESMLLSGYQPSNGEAVIRNSMPGEITLRLEAPPIQGLDVKLDKTTLKSGEEARLTVRYDPPTKDPKPASEIVVHVDPTGQVFRVKLTFDIQPELKKLLPKELQK